jgi:colanic acid biosynthesis protein WcaH
MENKISSELYNQIVENMPIPCVDMVLIKDNKVLLILRKNKPAKNEWFFPGGRVLKNETLDQAVHRKIKEEIGIEVIIKAKIGGYETIFKDGIFDNLKTGTHTINVVFLVVPKDTTAPINLDNNHENFKWIDKIGQDLHPYIKQVLKDFNVFN